MGCHSGCTLQRLVQTDVMTLNQRLKGKTNIWKFVSHHRPLKPTVQTGRLDEKVPTVHESKQETYSLDRDFAG